MTFAPDAEQFMLHGECFARGHDEMRQRFGQTRFSTARVLDRGRVILIFRVVILKARRPCLPYN